LSPLLFNVCLDNIIRNIKRNLPNEIEFFMWADDIAILTPTKLVELTFLSLEKEANKIDLKVNRKKCGIMPLINVRTRKLQKTK
jgi:hypothetical protein